ncbi:hypothetical protein OIU79_008436 [Salix purpurea]|uniref:Uncharacterized protein n=1 Tax=Salix purpurea TaxID=77065 RepID=A0A9Q0TIE1_SALPP|nr:hypothetical protein OIU79_008436 [Salix purpurea]
MASVDEATAKYYCREYNAEAEILAGRAQHLPIAQAAPIHEQLLSLFPTAFYLADYSAAEMPQKSNIPSSRGDSSSKLSELHAKLTSKQELEIEFAHNHGLDS